MANALQFALSNPNPGMEDEFNAWYAGSHLLHGLETPGILSGQRFHRTPGPWPSGRHDYLMIWELDDPAFALAELAKVKGTADMPISPAIDMATVQPPTMWRRAEVRSGCSTSGAEGFGTIVLGLYNAAQGEDRAFVQHLVETGLYRIAALPGIGAAQYLHISDEQIRGNCRKYPHGVLVELEDVETAIPALNAVLAQIPHADPERWLAIVFTPAGKRVTKDDAAGVVRA